MAVTTKPISVMGYAPRQGWVQGGSYVATATARQASELRFATVCLCIALFGNRLGIKIGDSSLSFVAPAILVYAVFAFIKGTLRFNKARLSMFFLLVSLTLASVTVQMIQPDRFAAGFSFLSFGQFLILTSLVTLCFTEPLDESEFYKRVNAIFALIAIAGLIQFVAQFGGLSMFSFKSILPDNLTYENGYHVEVPIGIGTGNYFKSNGFFLLEPSICSQLMAMALCAEILVLARPRYVVLFLVALVVSLSGTGWLILGSFVITIAIGMKVRGLLLALATIGLLAGTMAILAFAAPDVFGLFWGRIGEFGAPGTSAHDRFIAPFWALSDVIARAPWASLAGIGAGAGARLTSFTYEFSQNTPVKLMIEFGIPVMLAYTALLLTGSKTRAQAILLVPAMVMVLFTGENAQLPPVLYPALLMVCIPSLKDSSRAKSRDRHRYNDLQMSS